MNETVRQTRNYLMRLFEEHGFHPRTDLGQNFLIDLNLVEFVVDQADVGPDDVVLEVGTGTGSMTAYLADRAASVVSFEVDRRMYELAQKVLTPYSNVELFNQDALKNKNRFAPELLERLHSHLSDHPDRKLKLVANLPYNIATPVVSNLVGSEFPWRGIVITIQRELGQRMAAKPGDSHYGALSVWLQSQCRIRILKRLPPAVFWPRPRVHSAIVRLLPNPRRAAEINDREFLHDFLRRLFHQRRKYLRSVVVGMYRKQFSKSEIDELLAECGLPGDVRAEQLDVTQLVGLANRLQSELFAVGK